MVASINALGLWMLTLSAINIYNAVLITCLYVSDYKIVGRALKWAQCNARGGAHDPGEQVYIHNFIDNGFILLRLGECEILSL